MARVTVTRTVDRLSRWVWSAVLAIGAVASAALALAMVAALVLVIGAGVYLLRLWAVNVAEH